MHSIPLGNERFALVDGEDFPAVSRYTWNYNQANGCAFRLEDRRHIYLHRELTDTVRSESEFVRWHNNDPLDCRRSNMYITNPDETEEARKARRAESLRKGLEFRTNRILGDVVEVADVAITSRGYSTASDIIDSIGLSRTSAIKYLDLLVEKYPEKYSKVRGYDDSRRGGQPFRVIRTSEQEPTPDRRPPSDEDSDFDDDGKLF